MKYIISLAIYLLISHFLVTFCLSSEINRISRGPKKPENTEPRDFGAIINAHTRRNLDHFFYFVQLWPGSHCNTGADCCYPPSEKPTENFVIHGFHPAKRNGQALTFCDSIKAFNLSKISDCIDDLRENWPPLQCPNVPDEIMYWSSEWETYGTYSGLDQREYFDTALRLKGNLNLLKILKSAGIVPTGRSVHSTHRIQEVIRNGVGFTPGISCNVDEAGKRQLYKITLCANAKGGLVPCPKFNLIIRNEMIQFPVY